MKVRLIAASGIVVLAATMLAGCGASYDGPKLYPLTGKVTVNGQPPGENFTIMLVPAEKAEDAPSLLIQDDGTFEARTGSKGWEGAPAGKYKVVVLAKMGGEAAYAGGGGGGEAKLPAELAAYGTAGTTPKEIEVTAGPNNIDIAVP